MSIYINGIAILFVCLIFGCTKDKIDTPIDGPPFVEDCEPIPPRTDIYIGAPYDWLIQYPLIELPSFNPNNSDEIVIRVHEKLSDSYFKMVTYNLTTQEKETIFEGNFFRPKWSKKGWILFSQSDFNIYKIKSNGDSLTQLTYNVPTLGHEWNLKGDRFIYKSLTHSNTAIICDDSGVPLDTLDRSTSTFSWQHDSLVTGISPLRLYYFDPNDDSDFNVVLELSNGTVTTSEWLDDENIIWSTDEGIFRTNIYTKEKELLISSCAAKVYKFPTVCQSAKKVIFVRTDLELTMPEEHTGTATFRLFMMDFDGSNKEEIKIQF